ncbi:hypothetical protein EVAR_63865_1 [Eumeta japonica]|uniref:Uncharacterized protein n=1 Tax=Eumeta variegata TaxID=151549 RepID=A0A4C2A607_EUMVA|nr:hypothetical protein EVAR_63865_1 [Eumeta japonica]
MNMKPISVTILCRPFVSNSNVQGRIEIQTGAASESRVGPRPLSRPRPYRVSRAPPHYPPLPLPDRGLRAAACSFMRAELIQTRRPFPLRKVSPPRPAPRAVTG